MGKLNYVFHLKLLAFSYLKIGFTLLISIFFINLIKYFSQRAEGSDYRVLSEAKLTLIIN